METIQQKIQVPDHMGGQRFDQIAVELFPGYSRSRLQTWIKSSALTVNGGQAKPKDRLVGGEWLVLEVELAVQGEWEAENIPLDIVYEDEQLLVINKPAGMVVHPAAGNYSGTLLNALLYHYPILRKVSRAGIVHRLDKDTTGLMVVAKDIKSQNNLVNQLQARTVNREYHAVVQGTFTGGGSVDAPIGRHPKQRQKMAVVTSGGKEAITHYQIEKRYRYFTHLRLKLETGRTHQIRVHMAYLSHPLVGDPVYGSRFKLSQSVSQALSEAVSSFPRQALHAAKLGLIHPLNGEPMCWSVPLAPDFQQLLSVFDDDDQVTGSACQQ